MKCFTIINDLLPFEGFRIGISSRIGVLSNFCQIADDVHQGKAPQVKTISAKQRTPPIGEISGIFIPEADVVELMDSDYPVLIAPDPGDAESRKNALIYWAIDETTKFGPLASSEKYGTVCVYAETASHVPYLELLFSLSPESSLAIAFGSGKILRVAFSYGQLELIRK